MTGEVAQKSGLVGDPVTGYFVPVLEHDVQNFHDVIEMALRINPAGNGQADQFKR